MSPSGYRAAYRVWARSHRAAMIVLETVAGMAIVAAIALGVFFWYLSSGDISLSFLNEPIQRAVNARLPGYTITIRDTVLEKTENGVSVRLRSLRLLDDGGQAVAEAPKAEVGIRVLPLLLGRITPHSFDLIGARLAVLFDDEGRVIVNMRSAAPAPAEAPAGEAPEAPQAGPAGRTIDLVKALLSGGDGSHLAGLDEIGIRDASVFFAHRGLGKSWEISRGTILVTREGDAMHVAAEATVSFEDGVTPIRGEASLRATGTGLEVVGEFGDIVPRRLAKSFEVLNGLSALDLPVSAKFSGSVLDDGTIETVALDARIGAGFLRPPHGDEDGILVDEGSLSLRYDDAARTLTVESSQLLSGNTRISMAGNIVGAPPIGGAEADPQAPPTLWRFELAGSDVLLGSPDLRAEPLPVERLALSGHYDLASGEFRLASGEVVSPEGGARFSATVRPGEGSPEISLAAELTPMSTRALKMIWPSLAAPGAYRWIDANIRSGSITGGSLRAEFPAGLMDRIAAGEPIPDEALQAEFGIEDITSSYLRDMPYIRGGTGAGRILGQRFELTVAEARVDMPSGERLGLSDGYVRMPNIADPAPPGEIGFDIAGALPGILELLDHEPLGYPGRIGVKPTDFGGKGEVRLRLAFPLVADVSLDDVVIEADAELSDFSGKGSLGGHEIADGSLLLKVRDEVLTASGEVLLDKHPARVAWRLPFTVTEADPVRLVVGMVLDDKGREKFGLDIPYVTGPVRFEIEPGGALDKPGAKRTPTHVQADLKQAAVKTTPFGWSKAAGVPGDLSFEAVETGPGELRLDKIAYDGDGVRVRGHLVLDGERNITSVRLPVFNLSSGDDMSLLADRAAKKTLQVTMKGNAFNAAGLIESTLSLDGPGAGGEQAVDRKNGEKIVLNAEIARVSSQGGDHLVNARANMVAIDGWISALDISGQLNGKSPFRTTMGAKQGADARTLRVDAEDAGALLRFANLYSRAEGGTFVLFADIPDDDAGSTTGLLKISKFRIHNEPVLSTIDSAARAKARLDLRRPGADSTYFDQLRVPFNRRPGVIQLGESVLRGPAVGATISGQVDFASRQVNLNGTFIPAYGLNNMISRVPVLGQVLAGGENEGLVAISFTVRGTTDSPNVVINPLSVVTPGILRKVLFELGRLPAYAGPEKPAPDSTGTVHMPSWPVDPR